MGPEGFFSTNLDLANILGRTELDFDNFCLLFFGSQNLASWARPGPGLGLPWAEPWDELFTRFGALLLQSGSDSLQVKIVRPVVEPEPVHISQPILPPVPPLFSAWHYTFFV